MTDHLKKKRRLTFDRGRGRRRLTGVISTDSAGAAILVHQLFNGTQHVTCAPVQ